MIFKKVSYKLPDPLGKRKCCECYFYEPGAPPRGEEKDRGFCHRYAPKPNKETEVVKKAIWKLVHDHSWCGEFEDKSKPKTYSKITQNRKGQITAQ